MNEPIGCSHRVNKLNRMRYNAPVRQYCSIKNIKAERMYVTYIECENVYPEIATSLLSHIRRIIISASSLSEGPGASASVWLCIPSSEVDRIRCAGCDLGLRARSDSVVSSSASR